VSLTGCQIKKHRKILEGHLVQPPAQSRAHFKAKSGCSGPVWASFEDPKNGIAMTLGQSAAGLHHSHPQEL